MKVTQDPLFPEFIQAYRQNILIKYSPERLQNYPESKILKENQIQTMIGYFLELLYPEYQERLKLDEAFQSLKSFVTNPAKVFGLLGSIGISIWKMGKFLPQAFRAGIAALSSYITAHDMEARLLEEAKKVKKMGKDIFQEETFCQMLATIPKEEADRFRKDTVSLFQTLSNEELVERIIQIMELIIQKMKEKPKLYNKEDRQAIELGLSILIKGKKILENLTDEEKKAMISGINRVEEEYFTFALSKKSN